MKSEKELEKEIQEKGLNAPRLTPEKIDNAIKEKYFHVVPGTTMTLCVLTLQNGFQVTGESAAASLENFDEEIGRNIAFQNAREKIWMLEGYLLKELLYKQNQFDKSMKNNGNFLSDDEVQNIFKKNKKESKESKEDIKITEEYWLDRLQNEYYELKDKILKLTKFIKSKEYVKLDQDDQSLLNEQKFLMKEYLGVLKKRIKNTKLFDDEYFYSQNPSDQMIQAYKFFKERFSKEI